MTFIESSQYTLIATFCVLYTSGKKLGSIITSCIIIIAVLSAAYWPLLIALSLAVVVISRFFTFRRAHIHGFIQDKCFASNSANTQACFHSFYDLSIQYTLHTWLLVHQISPSFMRPDVTMLSYSLPRQQPAYLLCWVLGSNPVRCRHAREYVSDWDYR